ncbi:MAG: carboxymuconolactone decarboxylase family protein [Paracoccaceae bacterium]
MSWTEKNAKMREQLRTWNRTRPEVAKGFGALSKAVKDEGVLDFKVKELVALGIAISQRCEACIGLHAEALAKAGATRDEVADVLGMAVQMGGGPALMYTAKALEAFDEFAPATQGG